MTRAVRRPSALDALFAAAFGLVGLALGARPIGDNSTFVHLRTGIDIVAGRGIPRIDPYSATAAGTDWVVQSWLPSVAYGLAQKVDEGGAALLVLNGILTGVLALLVHRWPAQDPRCAPSAPPSQPSPSADRGGHPARCSSG